MKKKKILLLGGNYFPELTGIGKYNTEMMDWLAINDYDCSVITTYPYYPFWKIQEPYTKHSSWYKKETRKLNDNVDITIYRCPHYVPALPTGVKRILSDISFFISAFFQIFLMLFRKKFDYVITVAPPFQIGLLGWMYKKLKGAKLIYHVQDLQIDAAVDLGMIKSKFITRIMYGIEKFILRKADFVSSISDGMIERIKTKLDRKILLFPNWVDTNFFHPIADTKTLKSQFGFLPTDKIILYSGAIGEKQGLQALLQTANELRDAAFIKFIICGSGPYKEKLAALAREMALDNVYFKPLQPKETFNQFLNMADVHLVLQKANENELFLPSKLTTICAVAGLMIVTASKKSSLYNLVSTHHMGIPIDPENQIALTNAIKTAVYQEHNDLKENARLFAHNNLNIDNVLKDFLLAIHISTSLTKVPKIPLLQSTK